MWKIRRNSPDEQTFENKICKIYKKTSQRDSTDKQIKSKYTSDSTVKC